MCRSKDFCTPDDACAEAKTSALQMMYVQKQRLLHSRW